MNSLEKEFVPYQESLELKELGFDEPCFTIYYHDSGRIRTGLSIHIHVGWTYTATERLETTLAPTFSQAFRFFRKKYKLHCHIEYIPAGDVYEWWIKYDRAYYPTYEEAELACLRKLIEIVKNTTKP